LVGKENWIHSLVPKSENGKIVLVDRYHPGIEYAVDLTQAKEIGLTIGELDVLRDKITEFHTLEEAKMRKVQREAKIDVKCTDCGKWFVTTLHSDLDKAKLCQPCYNRSKHTEAKSRRAK
jgi:formylmethanofuran dehydrogenase subunit E